jgi:hypothetical protein
MIRSEARFSVSGQVEVFLRGQGADAPMARFHNAVQASGCTAMAQALYSPSARLNAMYILYTSTGSALDLGADAGELTAEDLRDLSDPTHNLVRVPVTQIVTSGNTLTLQGITDAAKALSGSLVFNESSAVYGVGLVYAPSEDDPGQDILFSAANLKTPGGNDLLITKVANAQIGINWTLSISIGTQEQ